MSLELSGTTGLKGVAGSVAAPSIVGDDTNTGISFPAADTIKFSTGGVERMSITNSGISGITQGKILQVVAGSQQVAASVTFGTNSSPTTSFDDTGLSASITPSSSSNKVFVTGYLSYYFSMSQNGSADWNFAITDGSNNILDATSNETQGYAQNDAGGEMARRHPISFLHSPNTTSSFTYKIRMNPRNAQYSASLVAQKNGTPNNISRIILMEVAA